MEKRQSDGSVWRHHGDLERRWGAFSCDIEHARRVQTSRISFKRKEKLVAARFELARVAPLGVKLNILKSSALDHSATLPIHDGPRSSLIAVPSSEYTSSVLQEKRFKVETRL